MTLLFQDATQRIVGALVVEDLEASWAIDDIDADVNVGQCMLSLTPPFPVVCGTFFLDYVRVGVELTAQPGITGFLTRYVLRGRPEPLFGNEPPAPDLFCAVPDPEAPSSSPGCWNDGDCANDLSVCDEGVCTGTGDECTTDDECDNRCVGGEYVPRQTLVLDDLDGFRADAKLTQCLSSIVFPGACRTPDFVPTPSGLVGINFEPGVASFDRFTFDYWDLGGRPVITGEPDYRNSSPWHVAAPVLHDLSDHFDPLP